MNDATQADTGHLPHIPWNKAKLIGQKPPLKPQEIWAIRIRLQILKRVRDLALFNLAIDSKLRGCDLVNIKMADIAHGKNVLSRASIIQRKTGMPVRFELTGQTRDAILACTEGVSGSVPLTLASKPSLNPSPSLSILMPASACV